MGEYGVRLAEKTPALSLQHRRCGGNGRIDALPGIPARLHIV
jgi:hypothetical protein